MDQPTHLSHTALQGSGSGASLPHDQSEHLRPGRGTAPALAARHHSQCWTVVATGDKAAGADVIRAQAQRAGADISEVDGSHVIMISQPQAVTDVIVTAATATAGSRR